MVDLKLISPSCVKQINLFRVVNRTKARDFFDDSDSGPNETIFYFGIGLLISEYKKPRRIAKSH